MQMAHLEEWDDEPAPRGGGQAFADWEYRRTFQPDSAKPRWKLSEFQNGVNNSFIMSAIAHHFASKDMKPQANCHQRVHAEDELAYALQYYGARNHMKSD